MNRKQRRAQAKKSVPAQSINLFAAALQCHKSGNLKEAAALYAQILQSNPRHVKSLCNLGAIFLDIGNAAGAIPLYRHAIAMEPNNPGFFYNLGAALAATGKKKEALSAYESAIAIQSDYAEAWNNLGGIHKEDNNLEKAEQAFRKALHIRPDYREAYCNLCRIFLHQDRHEEARALTSSMLTHYPNDALLLLKHLSIQPMMPESAVALKAARRKLEDELNTAAPVALDKHIDELLAIAAEPSFYLNYQGRNNLEIRRRYATLFHTPHLAPNAAHTPPFRAGILITDRHEGIFLKIMGGIINRWVNNHVNLTIICSPSSKIYLSRVLCNPLISFLEIPTHHFRATLQTIRQSSFNLLFYWEVGSDPLNYFLPFFRPAPIQCTAWGTADTTGIPAMDYFISSRLQEPEDAQRLYSEKLVLFDHIPCWFERPDTAKGIKSRADFNFSNTDHLYIVLQNPFKIHPEFDALLADILRQDQAGKIVLVHDIHSQPGENLHQRIRRFFPDVANRIVMLPRQDEDGYFSLLKMADVLLDPLYFGGGATTFEALAFGTPIVTWPGTHLRGRSTLACYKAMGCAALVAGSAEEYVSKAVRLGTDTTHREQIKQAILAKNDCLYANAAIMREFENFFLTILKGRNNDTESSTTGA